MMLITDAQTDEKMITALRRMHAVNRIISSKYHFKKSAYQDRIILNNTCSMFCRHEGTAAGK